MELFGVTFIEHWLFLGEESQLIQLKNKLESQYPLSLDIHLSQVLEVHIDTCNTFHDSILEKLVDTEEIAIECGIENYCGYGEVPYGTVISGWGCSRFATMNLTQQQQKEYPLWVKEYKSYKEEIENEEIEVVGVYVSKNVHNHGIPEYSPYVGDFHETLKSNETIHDVISSDIDYLYYITAPCNDQHDVSGPYSYVKNKKLSNYEMIESLSYLSALDKQYFNEWKWHIDQMAEPDDSGALPELFPLSNIDDSFDIECELECQSLAILVGETIKIPSHSPLRQQICYDFKKDDKKVIVLQDYSVNMNLDVEQLKDYGVQEAVCYHFKETDNDTHPHQYIIEDASFELTQQLCEAIERHLLNYNNDDFLSLLDKSIDELQLRDSQLYHKPGIKEWVYEETDNQIILKRYLYHYARINIPTMYRNKQVVLDMDYHRLTHIKFKFVNNIPLMIKQISNNFYAEYNRLKTLLSIDLTECVVAPKEQ